MKAWDGRFTMATDRLMEEFNNSLPVDQLMIEEDIDGSIAWAGALSRAGVLSAQELGKIREGLEAIRSDYQAGRVAFVHSDEDIHMAVERLLVERIGDAGAKLHTGRSRNDQVVTDFRLHVMRRLERIGELLTTVQKSLLARAERERDMRLPGYTHLQQAQVVTFGHYWLSMLFAVEREKTRMASARACADLLPLGSGAIAGSGFAVDRDFLARELGFSRVSSNSIDGVAGRDFALETLAACASAGILLSRYAEDLIVWSSREFGFVELSDAWSTGSSMMPQKKNPDSLELVRGKCGRLVGNHTRLATTLKGVGLTYFKDLQEDKEPVFDSLRTLELVLSVFAKVVETLSVRRERAEAGLDPLLLATDVADYLVVRGLPFRAAHKVVGAIVKHCIDTGTDLRTIPLEQLRTFCPLFELGIAQVFTWEAALKHRDIPGGTGPGSLTAQIAQARALCGV